MSVAVVGAPDKRPRSGDAAVTGGALPLRVLASWSLVNIAGNMMNVSLSAIIPAFYAKYTSVSLAAVGVIFLTVRFWDGAIDPLIGYLSDRTRSRIGARKPWIIAGALLGCIATYLLFRPSPTTGPAYLFFVLAVFVTAQSLMQVPHGAWGSELSRGHRDRSRLSGAMPLAGIVGTLAFMSIPIVLPKMGLATTSDMTPKTLGLIGLAMMVIMPICVAVAVTTAPPGARIVGRRPAPRELIQALRDNPPFARFLFAYSITGLGYGVYHGASFLFFAAYLHMGAQFPIAYSLMSIFYGCAVPVMTMVQERFSPNRLWAVGAVAFGLILPLQLLVPFSAYPFAFLIAIIVARGFATAATEVPRLALIANCADFGLLKTGVNTSASFYSLYHFVGKACVAVGGSLCFLTLSWVGFDPKSDAHSPLSVGALAIIATVVPAICFATTGLMFWRFPLNRKRQGIVRRRLENLGLRAPAPALPTP